MNKPETRYLDRRQFLRRACCAAVGSTGFLSALAQLRAIGAGASAATDFKALVCLFLGGGNDAANLIVPSDAADYAAYAQARAELALARSSLLPVAPRTYNDGRSWALHPSVPELQALFAQRNLAFLANVGTLVQPTTLAGYNNGAGLPSQLFSHIDQLSQWQSSIADKRAATGWGGRLADIVNSFNANPKISMSINFGGINTFQTGNQVIQLPLGSFGSTYPLSTPPSDTGRIIYNATQALYATSNPNLLAAAFGNVMTASGRDGAVVSAALASAPALKTGFPSSALGSNLANVARLIAAAPGLGLQRQIFFVLLDGWDLHAAQLAAHASLLAEVSQALNAFYAATVELGVANQVTTFTASDFGRTYVPNADGTDHGWGSHVIVMGGAVNGGDFYGQMPSLEVGGPDDTGRGRWIPSTSVDQYSATLATWFGVSSADLPTVLPNISRFARPNLGFMG